MRRIKAIVKILLIQAVIFLFLFSLLVAGIELHHWYRYVIKLPPDGFYGGTICTWGYPVRENKWGFRERNFNIQTLHRENQFVVLVLGDSYTWGMGLSESQRYSNLLEGYLQAEYSDRKIIVLNFAIPSRTTTQERDIFRSFYKAIKPDLVIVGFCWNDPSHKERVALSSQERAVISFLDSLHFHGTSKIIRLIRDNIAVLLKRQDYWWMTIAKAYGRDSAKWKDFENALVDIRTMTAEVTANPPILVSLNGAPLGRKLFPTDYNHPDSMLELSLLWHRQAEAAARQAGFITANCEEEMKKFKNYVMAVIPGEDGHPTAAMNEVYARKLFSLIKEHEFVE